MNNRKMIGWIVGVGCLAQFAIWNVSMDAMVPGLMEPAASTPLPATSNMPPPAPSPSPSTPVPSAPPKKGTALYALVNLNIWDHRSIPGYRRTAFGKAWTDTDDNGCDNRNDVLRRDLRKRHTKPGSHGCILQHGVLVNPYTGNSVVFDRGDGDIQIDHVVSLHNAWNSGASTFPAVRRRELANDPMNLIATSSYSNQSKGDDTADQWLPKEWTRGAQCRYVERQIAVKKAYGLSVTLAERDAMGQVLQQCRDDKLPVRRQFVFPKPRPIGEPKIIAKLVPRTRPSTPPKRQAPKRRAPSEQKDVWPGSFCSREGSLGRTAKGTPMICTSKGPGDRTRWRAR